VADIRPNDSLATKLLKIEDKLDEIIFTPSEAQKKVKAQLWVSLRETPMYDIKDIRCEDAVEVTGESDINKWWSNKKTGKQFQRWLTNGKTIEVNLEYLFYELCEGLVHVCTETDPKSFSAKVALGRLLSDLTGRAAPKTKETKILDEKVKGKTKEQLKAMINKGVKTGSGE